jgi:predicted lipid-binding transport protein (Tim44 family)
MASEKQEPKRNGLSGLVFVGCLMLGFAIGFLTGNLVAGLFGGLGVGFIAMAIMRYLTGEW